jgi:hypothetical protein
MGTPGPPCVECGEEGVEGDVLLTVDLVMDGRD